MAEVGLHGTNEQLRGALVSEHAAESLDLDRIAERSAGAVRLDVAHELCRHVRAGEGLAQNGFLRGTVGHRESTAPAVLRDRRSSDDRADLIAVALGVAEALQHDQAAALRAHVAARGCIERPAAPFGRECAKLRHRDARERRQHQVDAAGDGQLRFAQPQALAGEVDGHQRRGAGGVERQARALQAEDVRDTAGCNAERIAGTGVSVRRGRSTARGLHLGVVVRGDANEDACLAAGQPRHRLPRVLERLGGDFEQQALLRIDGDRLARRDGKEGSIEFVDAGEEAAGPGDHLAGRPRIRVVVGVRVPPIRRNRRHGVEAVVKQPPV